MDTSIGGAASDSYVTLAECYAYWNAQGFNYSAYTETQIEQAIRRAAVALDASYGFRGMKDTAEQAREWPRFDTVGYGSVYYFDPYPIRSTEIPAAVKNAQMELAFIIVGGGNPLPTTAGTIKREELGPLKREYASPKSAAVRYAAVDRILRPYLASGPGQTRAVRA